MYCYFSVISDFVSTIVIFNYILVINIKKSQFVLITPTLITSDSLNISLEGSMSVPHFKCI